MLEAVIGVDIGKETLDAYHLARDAYARFTNDDSGFRALIEWIDGEADFIVYEPTGPYHRRFAAAMHAAGLALAPVNPMHARRLAEGFGRLAKTDRADAKSLAHIGIVASPRIAPPPSQAAMELKELKAARDALVRDRIDAKNRAQNRLTPMLRRQARARLAHVERQIAAVDREIDQRLQDDDALKRRFEILTSIPGVGEITAIALLVDMPELGLLDSPQAASLAGVAPRDRASGSWTGRSVVKGGRARVRKSLYMPAVSTCRSGAPLREVYDRLRRAGKPAKVALVAVMRKLLVLANALMRDDRLWTSEPPSPVPLGAASP